MRLQVGFAAVVMLSSAVATAQPVPKHEHDNARVGYGDDKPAKAEPAPRDRVELASPTPTSHGKEFFVVGANLGPFTRIELEGVEGHIDVRRVTIAYDDGTQQQFSLDRRLAKDTIAVIRLGEPRAIDQIVITTDRAPVGKYVLYGVHGSSGGGVASR